MRWGRRRNREGVGAGHPPGRAGQPVEGAGWEGQGGRVSSDANGVCLQSARDQ